MSRKEARTLFHYVEIARAREQMDWIFVKRFLMINWHGRDVKNWKVRME